MAKPSTPTLPRSIVESAPSTAVAVGELTSLRSTLNKIKQELDAADEAGAIQLARGFVCLRKLKDRVEEFSSDFEDLYRQFSSIRVPAALEKAQLQHVPLTEGFRVGVSQRTYASIKKDCKDKAYEWLRKNGLAEVIQETVNASTLSAAVSYRIEEENLSVPADLFNVYPVDTTSVTAIAPKGKS